MTKLKCMFFCGCLLLSGCQQTELNEQLKSLRSENEQLKERLEESNSIHQPSEDSSERLVHVVWFKLKPELGDTDLENLLIEIDKLNQIEVVKELEVGKFADLGDPRAMKDFQLVMSMKFESKTQYHEYQEHPIHLALKNVVGNFIAGPPVTYDYWDVPRLK